MRHSFLSRSLPILLISLVSFASAQQLKIEKYRLRNGMTVILHEDRSLPVATVNLWYYVGSKDEPPRRSGFAHLFEHLMFMGTERVPGSDFDQIMEGGGGANNATTSTDRTNYYSSGPSDLLPTLLWLEADRMEDLGRMMDQKKLDLQRDVVRNERRESFENQPYGMAYLRIYEEMYPAGHPYHFLPIGSHADLEAATVQDVKDFFATYYVPNNASLVVAGDFDSKTIKPLIERLFGSLPRRDDPPRRTVARASLGGVRKITVVDNVPAMKTVMVWHSPAAYKPGDVEMNLTASILSSGVSSRLYQRLVSESSLATEVSAYQSSAVLGSLFIIEATATQRVSLDKLEREIDVVLNEYVAKGPTATELQRQAAQAEYGMATAMQSVQNRADILNEFEFHFGNPNSFARLLDRYRSATVIAVRDVAKSVLNPNARLILRVVPAQTPPAENPRAQRPSASAERPFKPQSPVTFKLSNGIPVYFWPRPDIPLMEVTTLFRGGAALDTAAKAGTTSLMASMLDQGAGTRSADQFEAALDALGANFSAGSGRLTTRATLSVLGTNFDKALPLYADALRRPRFEEKDWQRVQRVHLSDLEQTLENPSALASLVAARELFGWEHPYGRPAAGARSTVRAIKAADLKAAHTRLIGPANATIFVAGNLSLAQLKTALERELGTWQATAKAQPWPALKAPEREGLRVVVVDKPQAVQTVIRFLMPAPNYADPNRRTLEALSTLFGGMFTSRINQKLREEKGYSYGAGSGFTMDPILGSFTAVSSVRADVTGPALKDFLDEFARIRQGDVTSEEAIKARKAMRTANIDAMSTLSGVLSVAIDLHLNGRPFSALGEELERIATIDEAAVNALAPSAIPIERGVLVLVGDKELILKQIEGLGLPTPIVVKPPE